MVAVCGVIKSAKIVRMDENSRPGSVGAYLLKKYSGAGGGGGRIFLSTKAFRLLNTSEPSDVVKIELPIY